MAERDELIAAWNEVLRAHEINDYCPNGLQVEGSAHVSRVAFAVSVSLTLFQQAWAWGAQMIVVHHGLLWSRDGGPIRRSFKERLKFLLCNDITLVGYHLPLDRHPELGNNAQACQKLGLIEVKPFALYQGRDIGFWGQQPPEPADSFFARVRSCYGRDLHIFGAGPQQIRTVGIVSGGAANHMKDALDLHLDCFISGEVEEYTPRQAEEEGIHYVAAGHYATERLGIMALEQWTARNLEVETRFIDIDNPV